MLYNTAITKLNVQKGFLVEMLDGVVGYVFVIARCSLSGLG